MTVVEVAGGAGEIGRALVSSFASDLFEAHILDIDPSARKVATRVNGKAHVFDAHDPEAIAVLESVPRVDVLVNCVGAWPLIDLDKLTPPRWRQLVDVNLNVSCTTTWACRSGLRATSGSVINIASAIALKGHPELAHYPAAKAGLIGMTKSLAQSLGPDCVRVNVVAPGLIETERNARTLASNERADFRMSRALHIDDAVSAVRFFASPSSRAITGQTLVADGGTVMH